MYSERGDAYSHIIEDIGNMRPLSDEQIESLVQRPHTDLIEVIMIMNRTLQLLIECINSSQYDMVKQKSINSSQRDMIKRKSKTFGRLASNSRLVSNKVQDVRARNFERLIADYVPEVKTPEPIKQVGSNDSILALLKCKQG
jgi:hypothetical protein